MSPQQNLECVSMYRHRLVNRTSIEPADIAILSMKAHQPMNLRYFGECSVDRLMRPRNRQPFDSDTHERAEAGLGALNDQML